MNPAILGQPSEHLPLVPKQDAKSAPQKRQRHIGHDGRNITTLNNPGSDKFREAVSPQVLVDGDRDEYRAGDRLIGVDGVCGSDGREGSDLDAETRVPYDDDDLPVPRMLVPNGLNDVADEHNNDKGDHGRESHFRLADPAVAFCEVHRDPIRERAGGDEADDGPDEDGPVVKS